MELSTYESELRSAKLRRNTISTYVQHPERFINWLEHAYTPRGPLDRTGSRPSHTRSKYSPLATWLATSAEDFRRLRFEEIEEILGFELPASARKHRAWWANETSGNHTHAQGWMSAGFASTDVNLSAELVTFKRSERNGSGF